MASASTYSEAISFPLLHEFVTQNKLAQAYRKKIMHFIRCNPYSIEIRRGRIILLFGPHVVVCQNVP